MVVVIAKRRQQKGNHLKYWVLALRKMYFVQLPNCLSVRDLFLIEELEHCILVCNFKLRS